MTAVTAETDTLISSFLELFVASTAFVGLTTVGTKHVY